jgi:5,10-methylene-tetrahydrofolate dehydrogenase/methenyl tetrahydrofolate cyclohydrolase
VLHKKLSERLGGVPGVILFDSAPYHRQVKWSMDGFHPTNEGHCTLAAAANDILSCKPQALRQYMGSPNSINISLVAISTIIGGVVSTILLNIPVFNPYEWAKFVKIYNRLTTKNTQLIIHN